VGLGFVCELTPSCNLRCSFCYNVWLEPGGPKIGEPLDAARWAEILSHLPMERVDWICLAGGEPLLSDSLIPLARELRGRYPRVRLGLATNGVLLTEERLGELAPLLDYIELSMLSLDPGRYARITSKDLLPAAKAAMIRVAGTSLPMNVAITLLPMPRGELRRILEFALAFGARQISLNRFAASGRGLRDEPRHRLELDALRGLLREADAFGAERRFPLDVTLPVEDCLLPHRDFAHLRFHPCVCGDEKWTIGPNGQLRACEQSAAELGDLRRSPFEILRDHPSATELRAQNLRDECLECAAWSRCGGGCRFVGRGAQPRSAPLGR